MKWIIGRRSDEDWLYWAGNGRTWDEDKNAAMRYDNRAKALYKRNELRQYSEDPVWVIEVEPTERVDVTFSVTVCIEIGHDSPDEVIARHAIPHAIEVLRNDGALDHFEESKPTEM
jgi:hypothetical protein